MGSGADIPWVGGQYTIGRRVDIPCVGVDKLWVGGVKILWIGGQNTIGRGVDIPWVGASIFHGWRRGVNIPWVRG